MNTKQKPYDLTRLNPDELEALLHKRPDLRKEILDEANRRENICPQCGHFKDHEADCALWER